MKHFGRESFSAVAILSGDQLYRMDIAAMVETHRRSRASATVAMTPVAAELTSGFGIMRIDDTGRITPFDESLPSPGSKASNRTSPIDPDPSISRRWESIFSSAPRSSRPSLGTATRSISAST